VPRHRKRLDMGATFTKNLLRKGEKKNGQESERDRERKKSLQRPSVGGAGALLGTQAIEAGEGKNEDYLRRNSGGLSNERFREHHGHQCIQTRRGQLQKDRNAEGAEARDKRESENGNWTCWKRPHSGLNERSKKAPGECPEEQRSK